MILRLAKQSLGDRFLDLSFEADVSENCCLELRIRVVVSFWIFLNVAQCASKFVCLAFLYARFLLRILHLIVAVSQGGYNGLMRTCLFCIHSAASDKMQDLILLAFMS